MSDRVAGEADILRIMKDLDLPICIEPEWDEKEHCVLCQVTLNNSYIALWPSDGGPEGVSLALAEEFERLARGIRDAVQDAQDGTEDDQADVEANLPAEAVT